MINASKEFKEKLKNGANIVNYADVILADGTVLNLTYKDFMIGGCQIEDKTTDGKVGFGDAIGKTLMIRLENSDERFSNYDFYQSVIYLYVALLLDDGTIEKIRKGVYYATASSTAGEIIEINAVDGMFLLDKDYTTSMTTYPATLQTILSDACLDCGIPIGFTQFENMDFIVQDKPESTTYRQVVSYVAQIAGYNARIDNSGYMQLVWYDMDLIKSYSNYTGGGFKNYSNETLIDGGDFSSYYVPGLTNLISGGDFTDPMPYHIFRIKTLDVHTDDVQITGVRVFGKNDAGEEVSAQYGEDGYLIEIKDNPFVNGKENEVANYLSGRTYGMVFRPFSAEVLNNPLYEPFDVVMISDSKGNVYLSIINSISYTIGSYTQIACEAEDPARNASYYPSHAAAAVVEARRNAEKQISSYDKAVQQMNQIAMNAMGYHTTYEDQPDGSRITYLHDKPLLEESTTIYKQTIDGFFLSTDGGKSYTAGFDKNGNAVVNILSAIGIVFDWARGGTLTLGGENNENGLFRLLDADGNVVSTMNKDGVSIFKGYIKGSDIYLGGLNNKNGSLVLRDERENVVGLFDKDGIWASNGYFKGTVVSKSATITGGSIDIETDSKTDSRIKVRYGDWENDISPLTIAMKNEKTSRRIAIQAGGLFMYRGDTNIGFWGQESEGSQGNAFIVGGNIFTGGWDISAGGGNISTGGGNISTLGGDIYTSAGSVYIGNDLTVGGTKARIIETLDFGKVLQYCYETPSPMFGDIGTGKTDSSGCAYIYFDQIFQETVTSDMTYYVFLQKEGQGDLWVEEKTPEYFLVKGNPELSFSWEVKVKQRDFEYERMETFDESEKEKEIDYEEQAKIYLNSYEKEILSYEEIN